MQGGWDVGEKDKGVTFGVEGFGIRVAFHSLLLAIPRLHTLLPCNAAAQLPACSWVCFQEAQEGWEQPGACICPEWPLPCLGPPDFRWPLPFTFPSETCKFAPSQNTWGSVCS